MVAPVIGMCFCCAERMAPAGAACTARDRLEACPPGHGHRSLPGDVQEFPALLVPSAGLVTVTKSRLAGGRPVS
jgi:hypothetical protein